VIRMGWRRRVLRRSDRSLGARVAMGAVGYVRDGMMMTEFRFMICGRAPWKAWCVDWRY
jgi:hypothetical protein